MLCSDALSVKATPTDTIDDLKVLINARLSIDALSKNLTLWHVSIPVVHANKGKPILLSEIPSPTELDPTDDISEIFKETPPKKTIHIIVLRPPQDKRKWLSSEADGRIIRPKLEATPNSGRKALMSFRKDDFEGFPLNDKSSFAAIPMNSLTPTLIVPAA